MKTAVLSSMTANKQINTKPQKYLSDYKIRDTRPFSESSSLLPGIFQSCLLDNILHYFIIEPVEYKCCMKGHVSLTIKTVDF
jgi:hypothetical protein